MARQKKDLETAMKAGSDALDTIVTKKDEKSKRKGYLVSFVFPEEFKSYLTAAAYYSSSPTHQESITGYVKKLIEADMKKHPDWKEGNKNVIKEE